MAKTRLVLPNGVDLIGVEVQNIIANLLKGKQPAIAMPTTFRLARLVTRELAPVTLVEEEK